MKKYCLQKKNHNRQSVRATERRKKKLIFLELLSLSCVFFYMNDTSRRLFTNNWPQNTALNKKYLFISRERCKDCHVLWRRAHTYWPWKVYFFLPVQLCKRLATHLSSNLKSFCVTDINEQLPCEKMCFVLVVLQRYHYEDACRHVNHCIALVSLTK